MPLMRPRLREYQVDEGTQRGSVRLTLKAGDGTFELWVPAKTAERLAADILSTRFELPLLNIIAPRKKRKRKPKYIAFLSEPRELGDRPWDLSPLMLDWLDNQLGPKQRKEVQAKWKLEQERWDLKFQKQQARLDAKYGPQPRLRGLEARK
jgi:hypothetical protein